MKTATITASQASLQKSMLASDHIEGCEDRLFPSKAQKIAAYALAAYYVAAGHELSPMSMGAQSPMLIGMDERERKGVRRLLLSMALDLQHKADRLKKSGRSKS